MLRSTRHRANTSAGVKHRARHIQSEKARKRRRGRFTSQPCAVQNTEALPTEQLLAANAVVIHDVPAVHVQLLGNDAKAGQKYPAGL